MCGSNLQTHRASAKLPSLERGVAENPGDRQPVRLFVDGPKLSDAYIYDPLFDNVDDCPSLRDPTCGGRYIQGTTIFTASENSAHPASLTRFITESLAAYPQADQVVLVLVGHGAGWSANALPGQPSGWREQSDASGGFLWDDHPGTSVSSSQSLSTAALHQALADANRGSQRMIDLLYLDGCSMGMVEVAYELRNDVRYLLASPNTDWASFNYDELLRVIVAEKPVGGDQIGKRWLAEESALLRKFSGHPHTYGLFEQDKIEAVAQQTTALSDQLSALLPTSRTAIEQAFLATDHYESDYNGTIDELDAYSDLGSFASQLHLRLGSDAKLGATILALQEAISATVIATAHQNGEPINSPQDFWEWKEYSGMGIYLPLVLDEERRSQFYTPSYLEWASATSWDNFLQSYHASVLVAANAARKLTVCNNTVTDPCIGLAKPLEAAFTNQQIYLPLIQQ